METFIENDPDNLNVQMAKYAPQLRLIFDICGRTASGIIFFLF